MRKRSFWREGILLLFAVVLAASVHFGVAMAETSSSAHYQVTQTEFGSSSTESSCSDAYCASTGIGSVAGATSNTANTANFGQVTSSHPELLVSVDGGSSDLGLLSSDKTATKTMTVQVESYLSGGYALQILGNPPKYNGHTLKSLTTPTASKAGMEQFGINVVANTSPSLGADPVQVPSRSTSFGIANDNYKTANKFMYASGDTIAHSPKASGQTTYTISMIVNISNATPAGHYLTDLSAVVVPTY